MRNRQEIEKEITRLEREKANAEHLLSESTGNMERETVAKTLLTNIDAGLHALQWVLELRKEIPLENNQYEDIMG